ncbi:MAG: hypothetical protein EPO27_05315 [Betaproteobacteria bacterium]|nr:MAG: hypothetical protein EPO27_05315 [Betaproteobacteria bacterium]
MLNMTPNEMLTLGIAAYAAIISTFVFGWDAYKWLNQGPKVKGYAQTGMKVMGGAQPDPKTYVSITAVNHGDRATTITNLGFLYYEYWWKAYVRRNRPDQAFIIPQPSEAQRLPYRFDSGAQWIGLAPQDEDVDQMIRQGYLFAVLYCSTVGSGIRFRLKPKEHSTVEQANAA